MCLLVIGYLPINKTNNKRIYLYMVDVHSTSFCQDSPMLIFSLTQHDLTLFVQGFEGQLLQKPRW